LSFNFDKKWVGPHFGRYFFQTHLVTLVSNNEAISINVCIAAWSMAFLDTQKCNIFAKKKTVLWPIFLSCKRDACRPQFFLFHTK
jgi:hypothetical protein